MDLCRRFPGTTPSQMLAEPVDVVRMVKLVDYAEAVTGNG